MWSYLHVAITFLLSLEFSCVHYGFLSVFQLHQIEFQSSLGLSFLPLSFCEIYAGCLCHFFFLVHYTFLFLTPFLQVLFVTHGLPFLHCFLFLSPIWNHFSHLFCWFLTRLIPGLDSWPIVAVSHSFCLFLVLCFMTNQWMCWVLGLEQFKTVTWCLC